MKTPAIILGLILLASFVSAVNVTFVPASVYETNTAWEALDVNNYQGNSIISRVDVKSPLMLSDAKSYTGWTKTLSATEVEWKDGSIETNVRSAWFEFRITAPNVSSDSNVSFEVSLDSTHLVVPLTILHDATPPVISNILPSAYARANNAMQAVSVNVADAETAVDSVTYTFNNCVNGADVSVPLIKNNDAYSGVADFSSFDEGDRVCYTVKASNLPGEKGNVSGELLFDGTAPVVGIVSPTSYATESTDFKFTVSDNIAEVLACTVSLDGTVLRSVNVSNDTQASVNVDLSNFSEGSHTWSVTCQDGVGLTATHAQVIQLDTAPPVVSLNAISTLPRNTASEVVATVTDTISLSAVTAVFDGDNLTLTQNGDKFTATVTSDVLETKLLVIRAVDSAGHVAVVEQNITFVPNHVLTLSLSPSSVAPGSTVTASGTLTVDGNTSVSSIVLSTPSGSHTVDLSGDTYSRSFVAPDVGSYVISAEFVEFGHTYSAQATLSVETNPQPNIIGSHGWHSDWQGGSGYVKPDDAPVPSPDANQQAAPETPETAPEPAPAYEPLQQVPQAPREAFVPKTTGLFKLGQSIKWLALLSAFVVVVGLAAYAFKRKPKDDAGIDWEGYFKGNGA
ncbi:Uncharacterised protein [uncultured archaeon]|nr:Uncharacterised protein [uncultured archaeon]